MGLSPSGPQLASPSPVPPQPTISPSLYMPPAATTSQCLGHTCYNMPDSVLRTNFLCDPCNTPKKGGPGDLAGLTDRETEALCCEGAISF